MEATKEAFESARVMIAEADEKRRATAELIKAARAMASRGHRMDEQAMMIALLAAILEK